MKKFTTRSFFKIKKKNLLFFMLIFFLLVLSCLSLLRYYDKKDSKGLENLSSEKIYEKEKLDDDIGDIKNNELVDSNQESLDSEPSTIKKSVQEKHKVTPKKKPTIKPKIEKKLKNNLSKNKPEDTILELHKGLIKIINGSTNINEIVLLIKSTYDTEKMMKMIVGNIWNKTSLDKKNKLLEVFETYIAKNYIKRFKKIKNVNFGNLEFKKINDNFIMIKTTLIASDKKVSLNYLLNLKESKWKIFDVLLAGSVSEIATKKSEFSSFIKNGEIEPLIVALAKKNSMLLK